MAEIVHPLECRTCGQKGELWFTVGSSSNWSFAPIGFVGLAVDRNKPQNSIMRCNHCGSSSTTIGAGRQV